MSDEGQTHYVGDGCEPRHVLPGEGIVSSFDSVEVRDVLNYARRWRETPPDANHEPWRVAMLEMLGRAVDAYVATLGATDA